MFNKFIMLALLGCVPLAYSNVPNCSTHCKTATSAVDGVCPKVHCKCAPNSAKTYCKVRQTLDDTCHYYAPRCPF